MSLKFTSKHYIYTKVEIEDVYDLMKQSAVGLSLLHNMGITHFDIKPQNMVISSNVLKIIDMGSLYEFAEESKLYSPTKSITSKIREFTQIFSPPEILRKLENINFVQTDYELGKIDGYSWAMAFFVILTKRSQHNLTRDINTYKLGEKDKYNDYLKNVIEFELEKIDAKNESAEKTKKLVIELIKKQLRFNPKKRYKMCKIVKKMREFEKNENIKTKCTSKEQEYINNTLNLFMIDKETISKEKEDDEKETKSSSKLLAIKKELNEVYKNIKAKDEEIEKLKAEIYKLNSDKDELQELLKEKYINKDEKIEVLMEDIDNLKDENDKLKKEIDYINSHNKEFKELLVKKNTVKIEKLKSFQYEINNLHKQTKNLSDIVRKFDLDGEKIVNLLKEKEKINGIEMQKLKEEINKLNSNNNELNNLLKNMNNTKDEEVKNLQKVIENLKSEIDKLSLNNAHEKIDTKVNEITVLKNDSKNLDAHEEDKEAIKNYQKIIVDEDYLTFPNPDCMVCNEKPKVELKCGHSVCKECIEKSIRLKFMKRLPYNYTTICVYCKKESMLSIYSFK